MTTNSDDPRIGKILQLVAQLDRDHITNGKAHDGAKDDLDRIVEELTTIVGQHSQWRLEREETETRVNDLTETLAAAASLDFARKAQVGSKGDAFDGAAVELNTIVEKLENLVASRTSLLNIVNSMLDSMIVTDLDSKIMMVTESACQLLGYLESELLGQPINDLFFEQFEFDDAKLSDIEERTVITKDGRHIPLSCSKSQLKNGQGQLEGFICIGQDISERKEAEDTLRTSEARLKEAQHIAHLGDWQLDVTTGKAFWSDELRRIIGITPEAEASPQTLLGHTHPDDRQLIQQAMHDALEDLRPYDLEYRIVHPDSTERILYSKAQVIRDTQNRPIRMVGYAQDVTERRQAEKALRASEARYRTIVETAQEGIWLIDDQGFTTYVNPKMAEMLGYTSDEMLSSSMYDFMDETARQEAERNLERRSQGIEEQHEFRLKHKDGHDVWTIMATNPIMDDRGQFVAALAMVIDITEQKRIQDALYQNEERLRQAVRAGNFGIFDHDQIVDTIYRSDRPCRDAGRGGGRGHGG